IRRTAYPGHFCPKVLGKLYRRGPDRSGSSIDQHFFSALDLTFSQKMQGYQASIRNSCGFLIGESRRFECHHTVFRQAGVLGIRPTSNVKGIHLVPLLKSCDLCADRFNFSREHHPEDGVSRFGKTYHESHWEPKSERNFGTPDETVT